MRAFVIGSKNLSVWMLQALVDQGFKVLGAYTRDDEIGMRIWHTQLGHASLKDECAKLNIPCYEGMKVNSESSRELLKSLNLDIVFSCFWGEIIKQDILDIPRLGIYNLHTAYLPLNRGSRPIPWALIRGHDFTGLTIHKMLAGVDNGPIVDQVKVPIESEDNAQTLYEKVCQAGAELFRNTLPSFLNETFTLHDQIESQSTYQPRGEPFGGQINESWSDVEKKRFKRAFTFPPFRAFRLPPKQIGRTAKVYFVSESVMEFVSIPEPCSQFIENGIGNKEIRNILRRVLEPARNKGVVFDCSLIGMYAVHDILKLLGCGFCVSDFQHAQHFSGKLNQPYRYENGLLEIPAVRISNINDLRILLEHGRLISEKISRDYYIPIINDGTLSDGDISEELLRTNFGHLTFTEVYHHYDTEYEFISS